MSDDQKVNGDETEESNTTTPDAESENTPKGEEEETKASESKEGEEKDKAKDKIAFNESLLDTEDSEKTETPPTPKAKENDAFTQKQKQIEVWVKRFDGRINPKTNEEYKMDDIPHDWLKQDVSDKLHESGNEIVTEEKKKETKSSVDDDVLDKLDYRDLKRQIPELSQSKQEEIATLFKQLKEDGVKSDFKALSYALERSNVEIEAEKRGKKAALMGAPSGGSSGGVNPVEKDNMSSEFRKKTGITKEIEKRAKNFNFLNPSENAT